MNLPDVTLASVIEASPSTTRPISKLPATLLQKIFTLSIPKFEGELHRPYIDILMGGITIYSPPLDEPTFTRTTDENDSMFIGGFHPDSVRISIQTVSRHWRNVLHATPAAWTTLILSTKKADGSSKLLWIEKCLALSGSHMIEIFLSFPYGPSVISCMRPIRPHFNRVTRLFCAAGARHAIEIELVSSSRVSRSARRGGGIFPRLEELVLLQESEELPIFDTNRFHASILLPSLKKLRWPGYLLRYLAVETRLSLASSRLLCLDVPPTQLELAGCRNLRILDIDATDWDFEWDLTFPVVQPKLRLCLLQSLRLAFDGIKLATRFMDSLSAPELEVLSYRNITEGSVNNIERDLPFINTISKIGLTKLKHLSLRGLNLPTLELKSKSPTFEAFPNLTTLSFVQCGLGPHFLEMALSTTSLSVPSGLQTLSLVHTHFTVQDLIHLLGDSNLKSVKWAPLNFQAGDVRTLTGMCGRLNFRLDHPDQGGKVVIISRA